MLPPIAATTVGSFPRPNWLAISERTLVKFRLEGADLKEAQDDATRLNMVDQEQIGLDLITDGEQRRPGFIHQGVDPESARSSRIRYPWFPLVRVSVSSGRSR